MSRGFPFFRLKPPFQDDCVIGPSIHRVDALLPLYFHKSELFGAAQHAVIAAPGFQQEALLAEGADGIVFRRVLALVDGLRPFSKVFNRQFENATIFSYWRSSQNEDFMCKRHQ